MNGTIEKLGEVRTDKIVAKEKKNKYVKGLKRKCVLGVTMAMMAVNTILTPVLAAPTDTSKILQPLENLKTLVIAIIGAVGIIILAKNVMEFAQAYQQQDSSTMNSALKGIVAGILMAGISTVLAFLGF